MGVAVSEDDRLGLADLQIATVDAIVGAFECARPFFYSRTARWAKDAGGFSYGTHQVSHTSGNLHALLSSYCGWQDPKPDPDFAARVKKRLKDIYVRPKPKGSTEVAKWEAEVEPKRVALLHDDDLKNLVELAAQDPAMRRAQDDYFYRQYLKPALKQVKAAGFRTALSVAVAFDSAIHSGPGWWDDHKDDVDRMAGAASDANETAWIEAYLQHRRAWLLQMAVDNPKKYGGLKDTVYRPDTFMALLKAGNLDLALPLQAHTYTITKWDDFPEAYFADPVNRGAASEFGEVGVSTQYDGRALFVQRSLKLLGYLGASATADGLYGGQTRTAVQAFQQAQKIEATGKVNRDTYERLCTQVQLRLAEKPDAAVATPDGLRPIAPPPRGGSAVPAGAAAGAVGAGTVALGMATEGSDDGAVDAVPATPPAAAPSDAPVASPAAPPAPVDLGQTTTSVGAPEPTARPAANAFDPWITAAICVGFIATIVLAAVFFSRSSHAA